MGSGGGGGPGRSGEIKKVSDRRLEGALYPRVVLHLQLPQTPMKPTRLNEVLNTSSSLSLNTSETFEGKPRGLKSPVRTANRSRELPTDSAHLTTPGPQPIRFVA